METADVIKLSVACFGAGFGLALWLTIRDKMRWGRAAATAPEGKGKES